MKTRTGSILWFNRTAISSVLVGTALVVAGCASTPPPTDKVAVAKTTVENAATSDTVEFAPVELKAARDKLEEAERLMAEKEYAKARQLAEQAEVDARLAQTKATSTRAQKAVAAAEDANRVLREELERAMRLQNQ